MDPAARMTAALQRTDADKCPRCSAEGFTGQCYSCGYGTGVGLGLAIPIRGTPTDTPAIAMRSGKNSPVDNTPPTDADKCPRCNAEGYTGQCHSCGYGTGVGLQTP